MKKLFLAFVAALALAGAAHAQVANGRATTAAPSYTNNSTAPLSLDLAGSLRMNCITGCAGGSFNNNADAVATSATNGQNASWLYGFNGATWDRLRVDANKGLQTFIAQGGNTATVSAGGALKVDASATTQPVSGTVTANQGGAPWAVGGNVASGAADSGNPVKVGGVFNTTAPTLTTGQRGDLQFGTRGSANTTLFNQNSTVAIDGAATNASIATSSALNSIRAAAFQFGFDGTNWVQSRAYSGATAAAVPTGANYIGANVGGNLVGKIQCGSTAIYDAATSGSTQLVALAASQTIYICGYSVLAGGTVNVKLVTGTGAACATGTANLTPAYQLTAQAGIVDNASEFRGLKSAVSSALCINASAAVAAQAIVYYTQF